MRAKSMKFRNFLGKPSPEERFGFRIGHASQAKLRQMMAGLARRLSIPYKWTAPLLEGRPIWENPDLPAGYTYLAQFIAHDCVFTSRPTGALADVALGLRSRRNSLLCLETIYGDGPDASPAAYAAGNQGQNIRNKFVLSQASIAGAINGSCRHRDIGRAQPFRANSEPNDGFTAALIPDPRNDVHAIAAQMTVLFLSLHNKLLSEVSASLGAEAAPSEDVRSYRMYFVTRFLCENVYREIVKNDFLPRLLHEGVLRLYSSSNRDFLDHDSLDEIPLEFAHAFRFGHAMVRPFYIVNDLKPGGEELVDMMLATSISRPWRVPLDETWMVQWSHFFEIDGSMPNLSRRIGPEVSDGLLSSELFGPLDDTSTVGLPYRDLLGGAFAGLWSVHALAAELRRRVPQAANLSPLLSDDALRQAALTNFLCQHQDTTGLSDDEVVELAVDPPLMFYVMFEAAHEMQGRRLGVLGSLLVAETLYKALGTRTFPNFAEPGLTTRSFEDLARITFGHPGLGSIIERHAPRLHTMPELVRFVAPYFVGVDSTIPFV
jgi:hypothetical protein